MGTNKRPRRSNNLLQSPEQAPLGEEEGSPPPAESKPLNAEQELEAWQEFAADHYETVEQLPLELHRNFRLLRELDEGALVQLGTLQDSIRQYIRGRVAIEQPEAREKLQDGQEKTLPQANEPGAEIREAAETRPEETHLTAQGNGPESEASQPKEPGQNGGEDGLDVEMTELSVTGADSVGGVDNHAEGAHPDPPDPASQAADIPKDTDAPHVSASESNLEGLKNALIGPSERAVGLVGEGATLDGLQIHEGSTKAVEAPGGSVSSSSQPQPETSAAASQQTSFQRPPGPHSLLPEIARLSRELVRTSDEKVAVAIGAYNAIDRHIRALDSALTAQEASILLGLRPSTLPSNAIDHTLTHDGGTAMTGLPGTSGSAAGPNGIVEGEEGGFSLGLGGGGTRKKGKKRKNRKGRREEAEDAGGVGDVGKGQEDWSIPVDPNEPRYCYCHRVSFGEMIGCDNDDCPLEWFHLQCTNLTHPPTGKWLCNICRPPAAGEEGGEPKRSHKAGAGRSHKAGAGRSHKAGAGASHKAGAGEASRATGGDEGARKKARTR
ncbi:hypothetical protein IAR50_001497 [Cryptococcus sp. DSM 104548]